MKYLINLSSYHPDLIYYLMKIVGRHRCPQNQLLRSKKKDKEIIIKSDILLRKMLKANSALFYA